MKAGAERSALSSLIVGIVLREMLLEPVAGETVLQYFRTDMRSLLLADEVIHLSIW